MAGPHTIGRERSFIVPAVVPSLPQMAMEKVGPSPFTPRSKQRSNFGGITEDPVPSPPDQYNLLIREYLWICVIITRYPQVLP